MALRTRILLVDDHPLVRIGLAHLLESIPVLEVCGQAGSCAEAFALVREHDPDVVVVDLMLRNDSGMDLIKDLLREYPYLNILVLSMHDQRVYAQRCLKIGAKGYLMKEEAANLVVEAVQAVARGESFLSPSMDLGGSSGCLPLERLSAREMQVFELIGSGLPTRGIAAQLTLSDKTIEAHKANIKRKLGIMHAQQLVRMAIAWRDSGA